VAKRKLSSQIVEEILRQIGQGEIAEGSVLPPESALCASFGVSRSVAREALSSLAAKGFIRISQGAASVVAPRHSWNILDPDFLRVTGGRQYLEELQEAREQLEPRIAALAAIRASADSLEYIRALAEAMQVDSEDAQTHAELDIRFHEAIAAATGNAVLYSLHHSLVQLGYVMRVVNAEVPGAIHRAAQWHVHIVDALESRDPSAAEAAMRLHLNQVRGELNAELMVQDDEGRVDS
jgi:DNA-binding FadR family transcriptional regulator